MNSILLDEKWYWKTIGVFFRYRFIEKKTGIFVKNYPNNFTITIDIENCSIDYRKNSYHPFKTPSLIVEHKDLVILYCVDRLLTKGYERKDIVIVADAKFQDLPEIIIMDKSGSPYIAFFCHKWGENYENTLLHFKKNEGEIFKYYRKNKKIQYLCIFSSYLDGGLPHILYAFYNMKEPNDERVLYHAGIFEKRIKSYGIAPNYTENEQKKENQDIKKNLSIFPQIEDYIVKNGEIIKYNGNKQEINLPNPIKRIGIGAFWNCTSLKSVKLNEGITRIGGDAFYKCVNLDYINIPSTVREIGNDPFAGCPNLSIENNSKYFILEDGVLYNKKMTQILHYPVKKQINHFEIPDSVQYINKHAFYDNKFLKSLVIPESVIWMENNLFSDCKIKKVINKSPYFCVDNGVLYNKEKSQVFSVFNHELKKLILPDTVQKIGKNSFFGCNNLEHLHISKNVSHIGYNPFVGCSKLKLTNKSPKFIIENGILIDIKRNLIMYCPNSSVNGTIEIPSYIEIIGRNSFCFSHNLKALIIPNSVLLIERGAFGSCKNLKNIEIPDSLKKIEKWAFSYCHSLKKIRIPKDTELGEFIFAESPTQVIKY